MVGEVEDNDLQLTILHLLFTNPISFTPASKARQRFIVLGLLREDARCTNASGESGRDAWQARCSFGIGRASLKHLGVHESLMLLTHLRQIVDAEDIPRSRETDG